MLLHSCGFEKAIDYSFYVPEHGDYEINGKCFGIEDQPGQRLLITERISTTYKNATEEYLNSKYEGCEITSSSDLGGRIFEVFYSCES